MGRGQGGTGEWDRDGPLRSGGPATPLLRPARARYRGLPRSAGPWPWSHHPAPHDRSTAGRADGVTTLISSTDLSSLRIPRNESAATPPAGRRGRGAALALGALAVVALVAAVLWLVRDRPLEVGVTTVAVRGGPAGTSGLTANGYVVARTKASVSSKLAGRLASLEVEEGDRVAAGAVIGQLEAAEYEALVRQARATVLEAEAARLEADAQRTQTRRDLARARSLAADSLISPQALQDAGTAAEVAEARFEAADARLESARQGQAAAEANLENTRIRAPFSGTVLRKDAEVGEVVAPSVAGGGLTRGAVVTMADLSTLEVEVDVNEAYIATVAEDGPADIVLDAYPGERFPGHVRQIVPTADRQKATVLVRVAIDSTDPRILPEMGARVVFREEAREGPSEPLPARVFIPASAARTEGDETVVYLVAGGRARRQVVDAGPVSGDEREVRTGLAGGEILIVEPPSELADGMRVRALGEDPDDGRE